MYFFVCNVVSCHCVALDVEGRCYTWGRNEACCLCNLQFQFQFDFSMVPHRSSLLCFSKCAERTAWPWG